MPSYAVRFKGMLLGTHRALEDSEEEAVARVRELLAPDDVNFSKWEAGGG
jgi:hypothetical protein